MGVVPAAISIPGFVMSTLIEKKSTVPHSGSKTSTYLSDERRFLIRLTLLSQKNISSAIGEIQDCANPCEFPASARWDREGGQLRIFHSMSSYALNVVDNKVNLREKFLSVKSVSNDWWFRDEIITIRLRSCSLGS